MLGFLSKTNDQDAISLLKKDHTTVKGLFDQFEKADSLREKRKIVAEAILELKLHAAVEEEIFYPAVRKPIGKKVMNEADVRKGSGLDITVFQSWRKTIISRPDPQSYRQQGGS